MKYANVQRIIQYTINQATPKILDTTSNIISWIMIIQGISQGEGLEE